MPRAVSTELTALLGRRGITTHTTLDILPAAGDPIRLATDAFTVESRTYSADLRRADQIQQSIAASTNRVTARIQNVDKIFGGVVAAQTLVRAEGVVGRCFWRTPAEKYWAELFRGEITPLEITDVEAAIEIVHDLTAAGYVIAHTSLADLCQSAFRDPFTCGYAGELMTCNKRRRSLDGCEGRDNEHRFGGMEFPEQQMPGPPTGPVEPPWIPPPGGGGGGGPWPGGGGPHIPIDDGGGGPVL